MTDNEIETLAEFISGLLDEAIPLGEIYRHIDSTRKTIDERNHGIIEWHTSGSIAVNKVGHHLARRLYEPLTEDDKGRMYSKPKFDCDH